MNRPISYTEYDNLGQAIVSEMYDGDGLSITTDANSGGVPDRPSSGSLRAKSTADFDELGRTYKSSTFSVAPTSGSVSSNVIVSQSWFNSRGMVMKSTSPGGMVSKSEFDGLGRTTANCLTDGGGDTGYGDADDVTDDNVLSQTESTYDAGGRFWSPTARRSRRATVGGCAGILDDGRSSGPSVGSSFSPSLGPARILQLHVRWIRLLRARFHFPFEALKSVLG